MDAQEFRKDFLENVKAEAASTGEGSCASFVEDMARYLVEAEVLPDFNPSFYTNTTSSRKKYRVDGYVLDEFDYTMNLIIADFDGAEERTMGKVASSTSFQRLAIFVDQALNSKLYKEIEMSTPCADLIDLLRLEKDKIRKYRFIYILFVCIFCTFQTVNIIFYWFVFVFAIYCFLSSGLYNINIYWNVAFCHGIKIWLDRHGRRSLFFISTPLGRV